MKLTTARKSKAFKITALFLAFSLVFQIVTPSLYAQTGAIQPELVGFKPIGANNMVDPFTGDFSYNIPLMHVPGPGGGYPINLVYQGGFNMNQEASWVGLGWNINAGVINRQVRGIPDDFNGEQKITKEFYTAPDYTLSTSLGVSLSEIFGADLDKLSLNVGAGANLAFSYNSYRGWNLYPGLSVEICAGKSTRSANESEDKSVKPDDSSDQQEDSKEKSDKKSAIQSNDQQLYKLEPSMASGKQVLIKSLRSNFLPGMNFNKLDGVLNTLTFPRQTYSTALDGKIGGTLLGVSGDIPFNALFSWSELWTTKIDFSGYGYHYLENTKGLSLGKNLMDFQRHHEGAIHRDSKMLPMPAATYDMYMVNAHGLGGAIRPYRGDVPVFEDPYISNSGVSTGGGTETNIGPSGETKIGVKVDMTTHSAYSGPLTGGDSQVDFLTENDDPDNPLHEPVTYRFYGEYSVNNWAAASNHPYAERFSLKSNSEDGLFKPALRANLTAGGNIDRDVSKSDFYRDERQKRVSEVQVLTLSELQTRYGSNTAFGREFINTSGSTEDVSYASTGMGDSQIGEIVVTKSSGATYHFGLPAYTQFSDEVIYSTDKNKGADPSDVVTVDYSSSEDKTKNGIGRDEFYSKVTTPKHAHAYLLTEILSEDYVDLNGDGPTADDLGDYVKFSYRKKHSNFGYRSIPDNQSTFLAGNYSESADDKATYTYAEKELFYLDEIRTKTHVAQFVLGSDRKDGHGVTRAGAMDEPVKKLDKIVLYRLNDSGAITGDPIQTVHFELDEIIGQNIPNSTNGKRLALQEVYTSYGDQTVSKTNSNLRSYRFSYNESGSYDLLKIDRWGSFQDPDNYSYLGYAADNMIAPYTRQGFRMFNDVASGMWQLSKIDLPTGGSIEVEYESDDYQYVQNRKAGRMFKVVGVSNDPDSFDETEKNNLYEDFQYIAFKLDEAAPEHEDVEPYVKGIKELYFKVLVDLMKGTAVSGLTTGQNVLDYVEGYAQVDIGSDGAIVAGTHYGRFDNNHSLGFIKVKMVKVPGIVDQLHPFRIAGINYLRLTRPDLVKVVPSINVGASFQKLGAVSGLVSNLTNEIIKESKEGSYVIRALAGNYAKYSAVDQPDYPSLIRLNEPDGIKLGGGHRVKSLAVKDGWGDMSNNETPSTYTIDYSYTLPDGSSSGVANWEPGLGGEENAMVQPLRYPSSYNMFFKDDALTQELPIGNGLYPSAQVGYSRILIHNNKLDSESRKFGSGIQEYTYYTAKDYPIIASKTNIEIFGWDPWKFMTVFIGGSNFRNDGYSQGYAITLNNMHGKLKSTATFNSMDIEGSDEPVTRTTYKYHTLGGYHPDKANKLQTVLPVLTGHGEEGVARLGEEVEMCLDVREAGSSTETIGADYQTQIINLGIIALIIPTVFPNIVINKSTTRSAVFSKVITQTAHLKSVKVEKEGAVVLTKNERFDPETGEAILTSFNNEFDQKVYNYQFPAHWAYPALGGSYQNIGYTFDDPSATNLQDILVSGDVLMNMGNGDFFWVENNSGLSFVDDSDNLVQQLPSGEYKVIQSGYDNLQSAKMGEITALVNPADPASINNPLLDVFNEATISSNVTTQIPVYDCANGFYYENSDCHIGIMDVDFINNFPQASQFSNMYVVQIEGTSNLIDCFISVAFPPGFTGDARDYTLHTVNANTVKAVHKTTKVEVTCAFVKSMHSCDINSCLQDVINATAVNFSDEINQPTGEVTHGITQTNIDDNPYRYGARGIWRVENNLAFLKARKQFGSISEYETEINADGVYESFNFYNWPGNGTQTNWVEAQHITLSDYLGNTIESENSLGIPSSKLLGYCSDLTTAEANNARYKEIAFQAFETELMTGCPDAKGHITYSNAQATLAEKHSGLRALELAIGGATTLDLSTLDLTSDEQYVIQYWKKEGTDNLTMTSGFANAHPLSNTTLTDLIDGWQLCEITFIADGNSVILESSSTQYIHGQFIDDLRLQPADASMVCYVYDVDRLLLVATLDDNNFARFYNYDNEQNLEQVKAETEQGVQTVQLNFTHQKQN